MLPNINIQNSGWFKDGGENVFFTLKFPKWLKKKIFAVFFLLKYNFLEQFFIIKFQNVG
jgi:hypothetical protein